MIKKCFILPWIKLMCNMRDLTGSQTKLIIMKHYKRQNVIKNIHILTEIVCVKVFLDGFSLKVTAALVHTAHRTIFTKRRCSVHSHKSCL